jgi:hypothetical protein
MNALGGQKPERPTLHLNFNRGARSPIPSNPRDAKLRRQVGEIAALNEALNGARERIEFLEGQLAGSDQTINELMCMIGRADREAFQERRAAEVRAERAEAIVHGVIREDTGRCFAMGEVVAEYAGVPR